MKKVAVILAGCGVMDGSEIHEATLTLLYLDKAGADIRCFAPDKTQLDLVNHRTQQSEASETRNVLTEAARISRGEITPLSEINMDNFDAVIFPGGFGAAKNLCTFAVDGPGCDIDPEVADLIQKAVKTKKVVGAICISPVVIARALRDTDVNPKLTIGTDKGTSDALKTMSAVPIDASVTEIVIDKKNRIVSTPAYMLGTRISDVAVGIEKLVNSVLDLAGR